MPRRTRKQLILEDEEYEQWERLVFCRRLVARLRSEWRERTIERLANR